MTADLKNLTIVSITYNNDGIYKTIDSVLPIVNAGARMIIQNGGGPIRPDHDQIQVHNQKDQGIYDAINRGIQKVFTKFFMLIHAGDTFIGNPNDLFLILEDLEKFDGSLSLNSQYIGSRLHSSKNWRPWMLHLGVQPPHLPVIYKTNIYNKIRYSLDIPVIADFDFFRNKVDWDSVNWHNKLLIRMETGGATSGGVLSFVVVSKCLVKSYGMRGLLMALARVPFKLLQAIY